MNPKLKLALWAAVIVLAVLVIWRVLRRRKAGASPALAQARPVTANGLGVPQTPAGAGTTLDLAQTLAN